MAELPHVVTNLTHDGATIIGWVDVNFTGSFRGEIEMSEEFQNFFKKAKLGQIQSVYIGVKKEESQPVSNVFENNEPEISTVDIDKYGDNLHAILPKLSEGQSYKLVKLEDGTDAVVAVGHIESCGGTGNHKKYQSCPDCNQFWSESRIAVRRPSLGWNQNH